MKLVWMANLSSNALAEDSCSMPTHEEFKASITHYWNACCLRAVWCVRGAKFDRLQPSAMKQVTWYCFIAIVGYQTEWVSA